MPLLSKVSRWAGVVALSIWLLLHSMAIAQDAQPQGEPSDTATVVFEEQIKAAAPQDSLVFLAWSGWDDFVADRSLTEKWLAQPEMLTFYQKVVSELQQWISRELKPQDQKLAQLAIDWGRQLIQRPSMFCWHQPSAETSSSESWPEFLLVTHATDADSDLLARLKEECDTRFAMEFVQVEIEGTRFDRAQLDGAGPFFIGQIDRWLVLATSRNSIESWLADRKTPIPPWLVESCQRYSIDHMTAVGRIDLRGIRQYFGDRIDQRTEEMLGELGVEGLDELLIHFGVESRGAICRGGVVMDQPMTGLFELARPAHPLKDVDLAGIKPGSDQVHILNLPLTELFPWIRATARQLGNEDPLVELEQQLKQDVDIDLETWVGSLSGRMTAYGSMTLPYPTRGWVFGFGIRDETTFDSALQKLFAYLENRQLASIEKLVQRSGQVIYKISSTQTLYLCHSHSEVLLSQNQRALTRHWGRVESFNSESETLEDSIAESEPFRQLLHSPQFGERRFLVASMIDFRPYTQLAISGLALTFRGPLPGTNLSMSDLPPPEVWTRHLEPSLYAVYVSPTGYDFHYQQTAPFLTPGVSTGVLAGLMLPAVQMLRESARKMSSANRLKQLYFGLRQYEKQHGSYPPAYSVDADGRPLLSWRVHLLPYLEQTALYEKFHLDEPWDSKHNRPLINEMPALYVTPRLPLQPGRTHYQVVGKHNAVFQPARSDAMSHPVSGVRHNDLDTADQGYPILLESPNAVPWTAPEDFGWDPATAKRQLGNGPLAEMLFLLPTGEVREVPRSDTSEFQLDRGDR